LEENRRLIADLATAPVSKLLESVVYGRPDPSVDDPGRIAIAIMGAVKVSDPM